MARAVAILETVRQVYEAALDPDGWGAVLSLAAANSGSQHASLLVHDFLDQQTDSLIGVGMEQKSLAGYRSAGAGKLLDRRLEIPVGIMMPSSALYSDREFRASAFYNEAIRPLGAFYGAILPLTVGPRRHVFLKVGRLRGERDFSSEDVKAAQALAPHLLAVWHLRQRLEQALLVSSGTGGLLNRLTCGVILVDARLSPVFVNAEADAVLAAGDALVKSGAGLAARRPPETRALHRAIAAALAVHAATATLDSTRTGAQRLLLSREGKRPLVVQVVPVAGDQVQLTGASRALAGLFIIAPERPPSIDVGLLAEAFGLAPREAALAGRLAAGEDLAESAGALGIAIGTARWYLKRILEKTETRRQAELVALVLRGFTAIARS